MDGAARSILLDNGMACRTLRLTEHQPREVRLRGVDVDALLATGVVEVLPVRQFHRYRVTAHGVVGVLLAPNLRVVIRPKIPKANLHLLLDPDAPPDAGPDATIPEPGIEAIDFLARRLANAMRRRAAEGLPRAYVEHADRLPYLQGRLDVATQVRESPAGRARFHVSRDELTADTTFHRLVKATAESMLASPFITSATQAVLQAALAGYPEVTPVALDVAALDSVPEDRLDESSQVLFDLCRMLSNGLRPGASSGTAIGPAFLLDLERLFVRYIERGLRHDLRFGTLEAQYEFIYHQPTPPGQPRITGRPHFVIRRNEQVTCVLDAKWKALDGPPLAADLHQVLAYAAGLGCKDVRLVYPGRRSLAWRYELSRSDIKLTVHTLRVVGAREKCEASMRRLVCAIRTS